MRQWCLRVSAYAQRLLDGLDTIDWTGFLGKETQKELDRTQRRCRVRFKVKDSDREFTIFTTRADTMFGVTFMVLAPEKRIGSTINYGRPKSGSRRLPRSHQETYRARQRIADRQVTGVFSGSTLLTRLRARRFPSGSATMYWPATVRERSWRFRRTIAATTLSEAFRTGNPSVGGRLRRKRGKFRCQGRYRMQFSRAGVTPYCDLSLNGLTIKEAIAATKKYVKDHDLGRVKINYRLRDAIFSRQRYWGEPFPVYYDADGMPQMLPEECLPLVAAGSR